MRRSGAEDRELIATIAPTSGVYPPTSERPTVPPISSRMPADLTVPLVREATEPIALDMPTSHVFLHVDGRRSIAELSAASGIPLEEAIAALAQLAAVGLVEFASVESVRSAQAGEDPGP